MFNPYTILGPIGILSVIAWLSVFAGLIAYCSLQKMWRTLAVGLTGAIFVVVCLYWTDYLRDVTPLVVVATVIMLGLFAASGRALQIGFAALGLGVMFLAGLSSDMVGTVPIDDSAQQQAQADEEAARRQRLLDRRAQSASGVQFIEDSPEDRLDLGGVSDRKLNRYEEALAEQEAEAAIPEWQRMRERKGRSGGRSRGLEEVEETAAAADAADPIAAAKEEGGRIFTPQEYVIAEKVDTFNLFIARMALACVLVVLICDYLRRMNRPLPDVIPLPIGGRWLDDATDRPHLLHMPDASDDVARWQLEQGLRKGESFVAFVPEDLWPGEDVLSRIHMGRAGVFWLDKHVLTEADRDEALFALEAAWFGRGCVVVQGREAADALLPEVVEFLQLRRHTGATTAHSVTLLWGHDALPEADTLEALVKLTPATRFTLLVTADQLQLPESVDADVVKLAPRVPKASPLATMTVGLVMALLGQISGMFYRRGQREHWGELIRVGVAETMADLQSFFARWTTDVPPGAGLAGAGLVGGFGGGRSARSTTNSRKSRRAGRSAAPAAPAAAGGATIAAPDADTEVDQSSRDYDPEATAPSEDLPPPHADAPGLAQPSQVDDDFEVEDAQDAPDEAAQDRMEVDVEPEMREDREKAKRDATAEAFGHDPEEEITTGLLNVSQPQAPTPDFAEDSDDYDALAALASGDDARAPREEEPTDDLSALAALTGGEAAAREQARAKQPDPAPKPQKKVVKKVKKKKVKKKVASDSQPNSDNSDNKPSAEAKSAPSAPAADKPVEDKQPEAREQAPKAEPAPPAPRPESDEAPQPQAPAPAGSTSTPEPQASTPAEPETASPAAPDADADSDAKAASGAPGDASASAAAPTPTDDASRGDLSLDLDEDEPASSDAAEADDKPGDDQPDASASDGGLELDVDEEESVDKPASDGGLELDVDEEESVDKPASDGDLELDLGEEEPDEPPAKGRSTGASSLGLEPVTDADIEAYDSDEDLSYPGIEPNAGRSKLDQDPHLETRVDDEARSSAEDNLSAAVNAFGEPEDAPPGSPAPESSTPQAPGSGSAETPATPSSGAAPAADQPPKRKKVKKIIKKKVKKKRPTDASSASSDAASPTPAAPQKPKPTAPEPAAADEADDDDDPLAALASQAGSDDEPSSPEAPAAPPTPRKPAPSAPSASADDEDDDDPLAALAAQAGGEDEPAPPKPKAPPADRPAPKPVDRDSGNQQPPASRPAVSSESRPVVKKKKVVKRPTPPSSSRQATPSARPAASRPAPSAPAPKAKRPVDDDDPLAALAASASGDDEGEDDNPLAQLSGQGSSDRGRKAPSSRRPAPPAADDDDPLSALASQASGQAPRSSRSRDEEDDDPLAALAAKASGDEPARPRQSSSSSSIQRSEPTDLQAAKDPSKHVFRCHSCGVKMAVRPGTAGKQMSCPSCKTRLRVPAVPEAPGASGKRIIPTSSPADEKPAEGESKGEDKKANCLAIRCPHCRAKLRVPATSAGKQIACPKCDQSVRIPQVK